jgi:O-antigen/teichoic acid export membrane protein
VRKESQSSYKHIIKATTIFGGVQVIIILVGIVRSKFIAMLLGPVGIGISGMLTATTGILSGLTNFGLGTSAIRDISSAYESGNTKRFAIVSNVLIRCVWVTGLLGMILTLVFSPLLSYLSFGNYDYTIAFLFLSITLLINQLNSGHLVILQGSRKFSHLAKANFAGNIIGLFTTIPLYYVWGIDGIVPAIIIAAFTSLFSSYYFKRKIFFEKIRISKVRSIAEGKQMLKIGFMLSFSGFITLIFSYIVRLFIIRYGGISQLGLYNVGFNIITTYVGIIFSAMVTEYYPRLSSISNNIENSNKAINDQAEIALIILGPIIVSFILFSDCIINILYTKEFIAIQEMIVWAAFGMIFKSISWSIAILILAKSKTTLFFITELVSNLYIIALNIIGYYFYGLVGLGLSFAVTYIIYVLHVYFVCKKYFKFEFNKKLIYLSGIQIVYAIISLLIFYFCDSFFNIMALVTLLFSILFSLNELNKRIDIKKLIKAKFSSTITL